jgi:hypothetical protein
VHPDLAPLAGLIGTFEGDGSGDYPTIEPFRYRERVSFGEVGKPFLAYTQRTWHPDSGAPMHAEMGYLRVLPPVAGGPVAVELVLAHPTGVVEVQEGGLSVATPQRPPEDAAASDPGPLRLELTSTTIGLTATAKDVRSLRRVVELDGDRLVYDLWMAYADVPETHHLHADLVRVG